jgi:hypothetical protein
MMPAARAQTTEIVSPELFKAQCEELGRLLSQHEIVEDTAKRLGSKYRWELLTTAPRHRPGESPQLRFERLAAKARTQELSEDDKREVKRLLEEELMTPEEQIYHDRERALTDTVDESKTRVLDLGRKLYVYRQALRLPSTGDTLLDPLADTYATFRELDRLGLDAEALALRSRIEADEEAANAEPSAEAAGAPRSPDLAADKDASVRDTEAAPIRSAVAAGAPGAAPTDAPASEMVTRELASSEVVKRLADDPERLKLLRDAVSDGGYFGYKFYAKRSGRTAAEWYRRFVEWGLFEEDKAIHHNRWRAAPKAREVLDMIDESRGAS